MDPNKTLEWIRTHRNLARLAYRESAKAPEGDERWLSAAAWHHSQLARLFEDLDQWLSQGGFPPLDWAGHGDESGDGTEDSPGPSVVASDQPSERAHSAQRGVCFDRLPLAAGEWWRAQAERGR